MPMRKLLEGANTPAEASAARKKLIDNRDQGGIKSPSNRTPMSFCELADSYLKEIHEMERKRESTIEIERILLNQYKKFFGNCRLEKITPERIMEFNRLRKTENNTGARARNRYLTTLLDYAVKEHSLAKNVAIEVGMGKWKAKKKRLVEKWEIEVFRKEALKGVCHNINGQMRCVEFNPELERALLDMESRRVSPRWLFPNSFDEPRKSFRASFSTIWEDAGLEKLGFHHLRHYFIFRCIMSSIDYLTIARWFGHADGGVLFEKTYGHLNIAHLVKMAKKVQL
ncbi:MAG TPA: hypothetical protein EYG38_06145 [Verrucomicrobia bacterium]|nr:hypothetical protein [Verrucomicrobiota bacterium]